MNLLQLLFGSKGKLEQSFPLKKWKSLKFGDIVYTKTGTERIVLGNDNGAIYLKRLRAGKTLRDGVRYPADHRDLFSIKKH